MLLLVAECARDILWLRLFAVRPVHAQRWEMKMLEQYLAAVAEMRMRMPQQLARDLAVKVKHLAGDVLKSTPPSSAGLASSSYALSCLRLFI